MYNMYRRIVVPFKSPSYHKHNPSLLLLNCIDCITVINNKKMNWVKLYFNLQIRFLMEGIMLYSFIIIKKNASFVNYFLWTYCDNFILFSYTYYLPYIN